MTKEEIRQWRKENTLSQKAAAELLGVAQSTLKQYEVGRRTIPKPVELLTRYINRYGSVDLKETK